MYSTCHASNRERKGLLLGSRSVNICACVLDFKDIYRRESDCSFFKTDLGRNYFRIGVRNKNIGGISSICLTCNTSFLLRSERARKHVKILHISIQKSFTILAWTRKANHPGFGTISSAKRITEGILRGLTRGKCVHCHTCICKNGESENGYGAIN